MRRFTSIQRRFSPLLILFCLLATSLGMALNASSAHAVNSNGFIALNGSFHNVPAGAHLTGAHAGSQPLTITLELQPRNVAGMNTLLAALYNPSSSQFHHWLAAGAFNRRFAPSASQVASVRRFLETGGLTLGTAPSPFLLRATGTTTQVEATLHTQINNYTTSNGQTFFQNATPIQIPASLNGIVLAVSGLSNTTRAHPFAHTATPGSATPSYGAGPNGSGLTPSQITSLYDATPVYQLPKGQGQGSTLAVFELSGGYTLSDITTYEHQFFGPSENVPLVNVNVDGGPLTPACPAGDQCGPFTASCPQGCDSADYSGDIEVELDVEMQLAMAPQINRILIYNAPNDILGETLVDEYFKMANDDLADSISTSWGFCEQDGGLGLIKQEAVAFTQMAAQGQSIVASSGDSGAFDCAFGSGNASLSVNDPGSQPWVTSVGGTSFESYDPGSNLSPSYPTGNETVWNPSDACSATNLTACTTTFAGGGGVSTVWAQPAYQSGPGVISSFSQRGPYCSQAAAGQYCREVPDVSADASQLSPNAEMCTGADDPTGTSTCAHSSRHAPGWFGAIGTSAAAPLWAGIIALWESVHQERFGTANVELYSLFRSVDAYGKYFHSISGQGRIENNNGFYPSTTDYNMATGIGTPRIVGIVKILF